MDLTKILDPNKWAFEGHCMCDGTPGVEYKYIDNPDIRLKVKPEKQIFSLYSSKAGIWDEPMYMLSDTLAANKL